MRSTGSCPTGELLDTQFNQSRQPTPGDRSGVCRMPLARVAALFVNQNQPLQRFLAGRIPSPASKLHVSKDLQEFSPSLFACFRPFGEG